MQYISLTDTLRALAASLTVPGTLGLCCAHLGGMLAAILGPKLVPRFRGKGILGCSSVHAWLRSASKSTRVSSPNKDPAIARTHNIDGILICSALLL